MAKSDSVLKSVESHAGNLKSSLCGNPALCWGLRVLFIVYAALVAPSLPEGVLELFDNVVFRLVVAGLVVYLSFVDPSLAILLAIGFVVSIQSLNKSKVSEIANAASRGPVNGFRGNESFYADGEDQFLGHESFNVKEEAGDGKDPTGGDKFTGYESFAEHTEGMNESFNANGEGTESFAEHTEGMNESFQGTESGANTLASGGSCPNSGTYFTNSAQLTDAQNNNVNQNQMSQVQTWKNELGPQGLNAPYGFAGPNASDAASRAGVGQFAAEF